MWRIREIKFHLLTMIFVLVTAFSAFSQNEWDDDNVVELEDVQVEIVKDREIKLATATRIFEKIPPHPVDNKQTTLTYSFENLNFNVPPLEFKLRPLKTKAQTISKLYQGYIKAGFGNYITPYAEGFFSNKRNKRYNYGIHLKHLSSKNGPVDNENSGVGKSSVRVFGKLFARKLAIGTGVYYANRQNHMYGYDDGIIVKAKNIEHNFNDFRFNTKISSINTPINYQLDFDYFYINDNKKLTENEFRIGLTTEFETGTKSKVTIDGLYNYFTQNDSLFSAHNRILAFIEPQYHFEISGVKISAGINLTYADDTLAKLSKVRLYPVVNANYKVNNNFFVNAYFKGSTLNTNYRELSKNNAFISANSPVYFTNNLYSLGLNFDTKLNANTIINAGIDYGSYRNSLFLINDITNLSQFSIVYDTGSISIANFYGSMNYTNGSTIQVSVRGDYYNFATDVQQEAWHRPQFRIGVQGIFDMYKKIILTTDLSYLGGIKAINEVNATIELDPVVDFNLKTEYLFTDRFSIFVQLKNIFGQTYQLYNRYPVKGFQFIAGISYSF